MHFLIAALLRVLVPGIPIHYVSLGGGGGRSNGYINAADKELDSWVGTMSLYCHICNAVNLKISGQDSVPTLHIFPPLLLCRSGSRGCFSRHSLSRNSITAVLNA